MKQAPKENITGSNTTHKRSDKSSVASSSQNNEMSRNNNLQPTVNSSTSDTRRYNNENDISMIKINRRFERNLSGISENSFHEDQNNNSIIVPAESERQEAERYMEIIDNQTYVSINRS